MNISQTFRYQGKYGKQKKYSMITKIDKYLYEIQISTLDFKIIYQQNPYVYKHNSVMFKHLTLEVVSPLNNLQIDFHIHTL